MRTEDWPGIVEDAESLSWHIGVWHDLGYANPPSPDCKPIPPLGERSANAIRGGHQAVQDIDVIIRKLQEVRAALLAEMHANADAAAVEASTT